MKEEHDLAKWLEGTMSAQELEAFEQSPEFAEYKKIADYSARLQVPEANFDAMYAKVMQTPKPKPVIRLSTRNWMYRVAAVIVIAIGLFFVTKPMATTSETAANGQQNIFLLPDQSEVTLNSGSQIEYKKWNWDNNRSLELQGEAFFKVAKGKTFDVNTDQGKVTVVGTQFNVKSRKQRFEVICFEGKVKVENNNQIVFLTKGQSIFFDQGKKIANPVVADTKPSWMNYQISFYAEPLESVVAELGRQYDIKINYNTKDSQQQFTGTIPAGDMEMALQIISSAYNFKYTKTGKNSVTFSSK